LIAALWILAAPVPLLAQRPDSLAQQFEVDFAIPDAPAFELLQVDESNILRPTTVRALTAGFSDMFEGEGGAFQVPTAFALEAAPFLLAHGPRLTLAQYRDNPVLYRMRTSAAVRRSSSTGAATGLALGVRLSLADEGDLRMNQAYIDSATGLAAAINQIYVNARVRTGPPPRPIVLSQAERDSIKRMVEPFRKRWEQTRWNAGVFDVAAGLMAASADSLGNDLKMGALAAWGTWARGFGQWGQLLLGGRGTFGREEPDEERALGGSLGGRFYAGTNAYKVFVEGQSTIAANASPGWLVNTGGETRLFSRFWANFSAGVNWEGSGNPHLTGRFTIKAAAPPVF
jgi:hypothetical protein